MFDFLSCGFSSVLGGLFSSLVISGAILLISFRSSKRGAVEPISLILCATLFILLFYQTTLLYAVIGSNPLISLFISYGDLEQYDWSNPITSLKDLIAREYNWFICRRAIWSIVFMPIAFITVYLLNSKSNRGRRKQETKKLQIFGNRL